MHVFAGCVRAMNRKKAFRESPALAPSWSLKHFASPSFLARAFSTSSAHSQRHDEKPKSWNVACADRLGSYFHFVYFYVNQLCSTRFCCSTVLFLHLALHFAGPEGKPKNPFGSNSQALIRFSRMNAQIDLDSLALAVDFIPFALPHLGGGRLRDKCWMLLSLKAEKPQVSGLRVEHL